MLFSNIVHTHTWQCLIKVSKLFSNGSFRRSVRTEIWVGQLISIVGANSTYSGELVKFISNYYYKLQSFHIRYTSLKISAQKAYGSSLFKLLKSIPIESQELFASMYSKNE